jgi:Ger(x)C family germination protein
MKKLMLALLCATAFLLTGCWDRTDIESRGFVLGIAIDSYPPAPNKPEKGGSASASSEEKEKFEKMELYIEPPTYAITVQLPVMKKAELTTAATGSGGGEGSKTWDITQIGNSFMNMNREMATRTNLSLYYEHLQVIVISESVAREGIENIMDFFVRDPEMRRRVKVFISPTEAKSILAVQPRVEDYSSIYLAKLPINALKNSKIVHETDLGKIIDSIHGGYDFLLPRAEAVKDEIKTSGAAVFNGHIMTGWISGIELEAVKMMGNRYVGGVLPIRSPGDREGIITMEVTKSKSKITPDISGDFPAFRIEIKVEGNYAEGVFIHTHGELDSRFLKNLEDDFSRQIEKSCLQAAEKLQEYRADVIGLERILESKHPGYWDKISSDWDDVFSKAKIEVEVKVELKLTGIVK